MATKEIFCQESDDGEMWCDVDGGKKAKDLTKRECRRAEIPGDRDTEWMERSIDCMNCGNISKNKRIELKQKFIEHGAEDWRGPAKKSIDLGNKTIENLEMRDRSSHCRVGRNRSKTQPDSYDTSGSNDEENEVGNFPDNWAY